MNWIKRVPYVAGIALASWTGVAIAQQEKAPGQGQDQLPPGTSQPRSQPPTETVGQLLHMTATVQKLDMKKRELTLKDDTNNQMILQVPEDVTRLDKVKKGDRIDIDYYQSAALSLKKKGEMPAPSETTIVERKPGALPGGLVARKITASAEVMKIDPAENKLTIKAPNGQMDTINVSDPDVQSDLRKLKKGDQISVTYSQALAAAVTPKEK